MCIQFMCVQAGAWRFIEAELMTGLLIGLRCVRSGKTLNSETRLWSIFYPHVMHHIASGLSWVGK